MSRSPRLILHLGARKTGSSYLQHCFALARERLAAAGIHYAAHESIARAARGEATGGNGIGLARYLRGEVPENDSQALDEIRQSLDSARGNDVLISSEFLAALREDRFGRLACCAEEAGFRIEMIYYVRSVAGAALSAYRQRVKRHLETRDFGEWIRHEYRFRMGDVIQRISRLVGADSIFISNFERERAALYQHFATAVLNAEAASIPVPDRVVNRSLSAMEITIMRAINQHLERESDGARAGHALMATPIQPEPACITRSQFRQLQEQAEQQIALVNAWLPPAAVIDVLGPGMRVDDEPDPAPLTERESRLAQLSAQLAQQRHSD